MKLQRGFTLIEILIALAILAAVSVAVTVKMGQGTALADQSQLSDQATKLNQCTEVWTRAGGELKAGEPLSATDLFTRLQTPVTKSTIRTGMGVFTPIDSRFRLVEHRIEDGSPRLVYLWQAPPLRPVWSVAESGSGFLVTTGEGQVIPPEDWTARAKAKGGSLASTGDWVWEYKTAAGGSAPSSPQWNPDDGGGIGGGSSVVRIAGPGLITPITIPGLYRWRAEATMPGEIELIVSGISPVKIGSTDVVTSGDLEARRGDTNRTVAIEAYFNGSLAATATATINIAETLRAPKIEGADKVEYYQDALWWVTLEGEGTLTSKVFGFVSSSRNGAGSPLRVDWDFRTELLSRAPVWIPGGKGALTVTGEAVVDGQAAGAQKVITFDIPGVPESSVNIY